MTPKKRERVTEDVLQQVRERCQQEMPKIHADLERAYWMGASKSADGGPGIARAIAIGLIGMILLGLIGFGIVVLCAAGGGV
jgi:ATP-dependent protease ClpP protease subunit